MRFYCRRMGFLVVVVAVEVVMWRKVAAPAVFAVAVAVEVVVVVVVGLQQQQQQQKKRKERPGLGQAVATWRSGPS